MNVALIQTNIIWENPSENRKKSEEKINALKESVDLIVLPEMFTTGFTMHPNLVAETMDGATILWLKEIAKAKNCAITGSLVITENDNFYNRMVFVFPNGEIQHYDKKHLFTLAGEDKIYTSGKDKVIVKYNDWKICLQVCYDLRFPVFSRNTEYYDLLIYVASWPKARTNAWDILLKARAVENLSYVIGVNRIGTDNNNFEYIGHSQIIDELGDFIIVPTENEGVFIADLDKNKMLETRNKLNFLEDKDRFCFV
ncbi:nitrilase family protein [Flavobacterium sp. F372]|uniref:Nitrilase family protein n=1 Tax=Flavobacterium bernardetii TaxID=2813823 RepID=A0ABR7IZM8_9FLAO|nr:nitrilase family protein [Flavobacterium bernardetii]MBC5834977.1 nitrilase family protein [Flavobacterium bernardetii]NHF70470.1 nitrilase family protein [Flavobacterium bernardetii]